VHVTSETIARLLKCLERAEYGERLAPENCPLTIIVELDHESRARSPPAMLRMEHFGLVFGHLGCLDLSTTRSLFALLELVVGAMCVKGKAATEKQVADDSGEGVAKAKQRGIFARHVMSMYFGDSTWLGTSRLQPTRPGDARAHREQRQGVRRARLAMHRCGPSQSRPPPSQR
jgi:hypothetical protein